MKIVLSEQEIFTRVIQTLIDEGMLPNILDDPSKKYKVDVVLDSTLQFKEISIEIKDDEKENALSLSLDV